MKFSSVDKHILETYIHTLDGLAEYLGEGYELVLHSFEDEAHSIIKIMNGHLSSRNQGDPISELTLSVLEGIRNSGGKDSISYFNRNQFGEPVKATAIAIRGAEKQIIGLMCINFYLNTPFTRVMGSFIPEHNSMQKAPVIESLPENPDDIIMEAYQDAKMMVENDASIPTSDKNKSMIALMHKNGVFNIKDSVIKVAGLMKISKNTVYLHLRNLNK